MLDMDREKWDNPVNQIRPLIQSRETGKVTLVYEKEQREEWKEEACPSDAESYDGSRRASTSAL